LQPSFFFCQTSEQATGGVSIFSLAVYILTSLTTHHNHHCALIGFYINHPFPFPPSSSPPHHPTRKERKKRVQVYHLYTMSTRKRKQEAGEEASEEEELQALPSDDSEEEEEYVFPLLRFP
jgi:hypothetical protein